MIYNSFKNIGLHLSSPPPSLVAPLATPSAHLAHGAPDLGEHEYLPALHVRAHTAVPTLGVVQQPLRVGAHVILVAAACNAAAARLLNGVRLRRHAAHRGCSGWERKRLSALIQGLHCVEVALRVYDLSSAGAR